MRILLALRALFFVALLPGGVSVYIPYRILVSTHAIGSGRSSIFSSLALAVAAVGAAILLWSVWEFFAAGRGTLAPVDPPRRLVITGLYQYTRNPMYNGVVLILLAEAWFFHSVSILEYAAVVLVFFNLFVLLYEEPVLAASFGGAYEAYRRSVPRGGFTPGPYRETTGTTA
jgi:protein-S-isoprenylcysteine O-methyltransferase Ste14